VREEHAQLEEAADEDHDDGCMENIDAEQDDDIEQDARCNEVEDEMEDEDAERDPAGGADNEKPMQVALKKLRRLSTLFRKSNVMAEALFNAQENARAEGKLKRGRSKRMLVDCPTRWSSTCAMVKRGLDLRKFVESSKDKAVKPQRKFFLSDEEWELMEELCAMLQPFCIATRRLSGDTCATMSQVLLIWKRLTKTLRLAKKKNLFETSDASVDLLIDALETHWEKHMTSEIHMCAAALDPSLKKLKISRNKADREATWDRIKKEMANVMEQLRSTPSREKNSGNGEPSHAEDEDLAELSESSSSDCVKSVPSTPVEKMKSNINERVKFQVESELAKCRAMDVNKEDTKDLLSWWKDNAKLFPTLSVVARSHLGINASSTASERIFSLCGHLTGGRRNQLGSTVLSAMMPLNSLSKNPELWHLAK